MLNGNKLNKYINPSCGLYQMCPYSTLIHECVSMNMWKSNRWIVICYPVIFLIKSGNNSRSLKIVFVQNRNEEKVVL